MAQAKKFGTFSGVFTPSILTILGVIMYMRLPMIVGNAGMWNTIGIILVAHIISVTTGLSVSSIATDKKVKAGGTYYMISRSLGLPIGGTLGLALAVGLAFSVSLYLIGFSESFLSYWGFELSKNNIRIAGSIALLVVTIVTFISTALALKSQFFILGAILLSLLSIFLGSHTLAPETPLLHPLPNAPAWMILFGIFFPAVTGFEAGVSMSGDLKDPKKSIPVGTIAAISVGLLVYIGMAIYFAYTVSAEELVNNPRVLLEIALWPPAVIAGIWSATISSALGSILSSPRILQAAAADRIAPKFFAKGHGKENEPRNALLLTYAIAEAGILVGELDLIARVVSMFFITTYGFLNLSCALENLASSDFRPDFKIPAWVSIIGSLACFIVMILLDFLAMIGATIVLGGLFFYLKRQELTLESGDTWEGVWSSLIRAALQRLHVAKQHPRNWRPNIVLFSGGSEARPHLVKFGEWLVRKRGILSNFELIENPKAKHPITKLQPTGIDPTSHIPGVFSRKLECRDIYEGMEAVTQIYGFSGIDPNTIMLGWGRNSRNPEKFVQLIRHFRDMDFNILLLDYHRERGFGAHQRIDLWWRGGSSNATLALNILKFLNTSEDWEDTGVRILVIVENSALVARVQKNLGRILEEERLSAEIKVLNNAVEKRPLPELIKLESGDADLVVIGLPPPPKKNPAAFIAEVDALIQEIGTTLLIHASSFFETFYVGIEPVAAPEVLPDSVGEWRDLTRHLPSLTPPESFHPQDDSHVQVFKTLEALDRQLQENVKEFYDISLLVLESSNKEFLDNLQALAARNFSTLEKQLPQQNSPRFQKLLTRVQADFFFHSRQALRHFREHTAPHQGEALHAGLDHLQTKLDELNRTLPHDFLLFYEPSVLQPRGGDSTAMQWFKFRKRLHQRLTRQPLTIRVNLQMICRYYLRSHFQETLCKQLQKLGVHSTETLTDLSKWLNQARDALGKIQTAAQNGELSESDLQAELQQLDEAHIKIFTALQRRYLEIAGQLLREAREIVQLTLDGAFQLNSRRGFKKIYELPKTAALLQEQVMAFPAAWTHNIALVCNFALMDLQLTALQNRLNVVIQKFVDELRVKLESTMLRPMQTLAEKLNEIAAAFDKEGEDGIPNLPTIRDGSLDPEELIAQLRKDARNAVQDLPEAIEIISEESFQQFEQQQMEGLETVEISLQRLAAYLVETRLVDPIEKQLETWPQRLRESQIVTGEVVRLVSFSLAEVEAGSEAVTEGGEPELEEIIASGRQRLQEEVQKLHGEFADLLEFIQRQREAAYENLNPYAAVRDAAKLGQYIRAEESRKVLSEVGEGRERILNYINNLLVKLLYHRSEGMLLARKLWEKDRAPMAPMDRVLALVETTSPRPEVFVQLPPFYRQLFLSKQAIGTEFWVGRQKEFRQGEHFMRRYRSGYHGALLVLGERNSGKTAFCRHLAREFSRHHVFQLFAPDTGSILPTDFLHILQDAVQLKARRTDDIFTSLPANSVLIINDLELWWERSPDGFAVINEIIRLVNTHSATCLFLINANRHSYRFINQLQSIDDAFISVIHCEPFDAEDLQNAILLRHQSTGLQFEFEGELEDQISRMKLARLFNSYFDYSAGNIGTALHAWISHIERVQNERLIIRRPERPDITALETLKPEWAVCLAQFVLHKNLTEARLCRIFRWSPAETRDMLRTLRRTGLLVEIQGSWHISPFVHPFLVEKLLEMEVL